ncbi:cytochrome P450 [Herbidospora cretacea]|uniref:cytochrome P450 n=1 Tax=Herbidospora cretacea TaxID=28444 RepID=UPI000774A897|nr:cytochrome P450 [Herbidospora cretacea]
MSASIDSTIMEPVESLFSWFREMLDSQPVSSDGDHGVEVFGYGDVTRILADTKTFSSETARLFNLPHPELDRFDEGNLVTTDPPRHRKLRTVISQVFTPRSVANLAGRIELITNTLLDKVADQDSFDLVDALAFPLPITVIADVLGLPIEDEPLFRVWGDAIGALDAATVPPDLLEGEVGPALHEMGEYFLRHMRDRRQNPRDDVMSRLANATIDGEPLTDGEMIGVTGLTMFAGHATTMSLICTAVILLEQHPEALAEIRANRDLVPGALEEVLRMYPPFPRLVRVTTTDTEIGGHPVAADQLVTPWIGAANRDGAKFPDPDLFDIHRNTGGHLVFGQGIHFCLGAPLARLEGKIALNLLLDRYSKISVDPERGVEWENPHQIICPRRLPVRATR